MGWWARVAKGLGAVAAGGVVAAAVFFALLYAREDGASGYWRAMCELVAGRPWSLLLFFGALVGAGLLQWVIAGTLGRIGWGWAALTGAVAPAAYAALLFGRADPLGRGFWGTVRYVGADLAYFVVPFAVGTAFAAFLLSQAREV